MKNGPYILVIAPEKYPGKKYRNRYAYEHHVNWWEKNGSVPKNGFEIHHLDGDHRNNDPSNLRLLKSEDHKKIHAEMRRKKPIERVCEECKLIFSSRISRKQYCSRRCAGKVNQRCQVG